MDALYTREILRLASEAPAPAHLEAPDAVVTKTSRICGSSIAIEVRLKDGRVADYAQTIKACALGQASSAIAAKHVIGKSWAELEPVARALEAMLKEGGPPPAGEWADYQLFIPARAHSSRHSAILLPFAALEEAFGKSA